LRWLPVPVYVVGVVSVLVWLWTTYAATAPAPFTALVVLSTAAAIGLLVSALSPRRSLVDLCYYLFLTFFLTTPAAIQVATGEFPWDVEHARHHAIKATALFALAMVAYEVGRLVQRGLERRWVALEQPVAPTAALTTILLVGMAGGLFMVPLAGLEVLLADRATLSEFNTETGLRGYVFLVLKGVSLATTVWALAAAFSVDPARNRSAARRFLALVALAMVAITALAFNPLVNPRFSFAAAAIALAFMLVRPYFFRLKPWAIVAFPAALFYVFPNLKALSDADARAEVLERIGSVDLEYLTSVDFDGFQTAANAVRYVEEIGLLGLQNVLGSLFFFIPRAIWPDKPYGSGLAVFEELGYWYVNVSMPLPLEFFLAAGLVGLVAGMIGFGALVGQLEAASLRGAATAGRTPADVLVALLGGFAIITMRGSLAAVAVFVGIPLAWAVVVLWFVWRRRSASAAARGRSGAGDAGFGDWRDGFARAKRGEDGGPKAGRFAQVARLGRRGAIAAGAVARPGSRGG